MKISGSELRKIIQEEVNRFLENEEAPAVDQSAQGGDGETDEAADVTDIVKALGSGQGHTMLKNRMPRTPEAIVQLVSWIIKTDTKTPAGAKRKAIEILFANRQDLVAAKDGQ